MINGYLNPYIFKSYDKETGVVLWADSDNRIFYTGPNGEDFIDAFAEENKELLAATKAFNLYNMVKELENYDKSVLTLLGE